MPRESGPSRGSGCADFFAIWRLGLRYGVSFANWPIAKCVPAPNNEPFRRPTVTQQGNIFITAHMFGDHFSLGLELFQRRLSRRRGAGRVPSLAASLRPITRGNSASRATVSSARLQAVRDGTSYSITGKPVDSAISRECA
jgi:hypothetical protein